MKEVAELVPKLNVRVEKYSTGKRWSEVLVVDEQKKPYWLLK